METIIVQISETLVEDYMRMLKIKTTLNGGLPPTYAQNLGHYDDRLMTAKTPLALRIWHERIPISSLTTDGWAGYQNLLFSMKVHNKWTLLHIQLPTRVATLYVDYRTTEIMGPVNTVITLMKKRIGDGAPWGRRCVHISWTGQHDDHAAVMCTLAHDIAHGIDPRPHVPRPLNILAWAIMEQRKVYLAGLKLMSGSYTQVDRRLILQALKNIPDPTIPAKIPITVAKVTLPFQDDADLNDQQRPPKRQKQSEPDALTIPPWHAWDEPARDTPTPPQTITSVTTLKEEVNASKNYLAITST